MFLIFSDDTLGKVRVAINSICHYRKNNEVVVLTLSNGQSLRSKEHTVEALDAALNETYNFIKSVPKLDS